MKKKLKKVYFNKYSSELLLYILLSTDCTKKILLFFYLLFFTIPCLYFSQNFIINSFGTINFSEINSLIIKSDTSKSFLSENKITKKKVLIKKSIVKNPKRFISENILLENKILQTHMVFYLKNEEPTTSIFNSTLNSPEPFFIKNNFFLRITFYEEIFQLANLYLENTNYILYHLYPSKKVENFLFTRPPPYQLA